MPANLNHQYHKAEAEYRRAQTAEERVQCLGRMLQAIPKHKGTEKLQAGIKSRLKQARTELSEESRSGSRGPAYRIPRQGAGQVVVVGAPNSGKSRIVSELTAADPEVGDYPFTTREPIPGMMLWENTCVQLIDTPPLVRGHVEPYLLNLVRTADAVVLAFDGSSDDAPEQTAEAIAELHLRKTLLAESSGFDEQDLSIVHVRALLAVTRAESSGSEERLELLRHAAGVGFSAVAVELNGEPDRTRLRERIYEMLDVIRVYTRRPGQPVEYRDPFTIPVDGTVLDLAEKVHRDLSHKLKHGRVWKPGACDGNGRIVGRDHPLADGDLVELNW